VKEIRAQLRERLPEYMAPSAYVWLEELPLTPNGKVDRRTLPAPDQSGRGTESYVEPTTAVQELVAQIWRELLRVERVGVTDNFFELGGHSLLATVVVSRVRATFQIELPLQSLFETPTVAGLAETIERHLIEQSDAQQMTEMMQGLEHLSDEEIRALLSVEGSHLQQSS
jgi:acyl carrier protein